MNPVMKCSSLGETGVWPGWGAAGQEVGSPP